MIATPAQSYLHSLLRNSLSGWAWSQLGSLASMIWESVCRPGTATKVRAVGRGRWRHERIGCKGSDDWACIIVCLVITSCHTMISGNPSITLQIRLDSSSLFQTRSQTTNAHLISDHWRASNGRSSNLTASGHLTTEKPGVTAGWTPLPCVPIVPINRIGIRMGGSFSSAYHRRLTYFVDVWNDPDVLHRQP